MTDSRRWVVTGVALVLAFFLGILVSSEGPDPTPEEGAETAETWTCAMHPNVQQPDPGPCPLCGMDLIPNRSTDDGDASDRIVLSERARALSRLRTTPVRRQADATAEVRLLGRFEPDERSRRNVTTWIGGRIDRLLVNTTGESIGPGRVIATLYSPEIYAAHQDLIAARRQVARLADSPAEARALADAALAAARERLVLLGVPDRELTVLTTAETPTRSIQIRSPFSGTVIERVATEGAYVETGAILYRVADLSQLWVQLDAYESDLPLLSVGLAVTLRVEGLPGESFEGRISFIDPTVDPERRTARVRVEVGNTEGLLRPGMFAEALIAAAGRGPADEAPLVIPASAPLFTGKRSLVYVESDGEGGLSYSPRTVRLGARLGDVYPVVAGLSEGERVVSRGAFALDADLQIRGGPSMMAAPTEIPDGSTDAVLEPTPAEQSQLRPVMAAYLSTQEALAEDDLSTAQAAATTLHRTLAQTELTGPVGAAWARLSPGLRTHATAISSAADIEAARGSFEPLSAAVETWLRALGNPLDTTVKVAFCPMAMGSTGARWVQQGDLVDNAYYGDLMRNCGEFIEAVGPGDHLRPTGP